MKLIVTLSQPINFQENPTYVVSSNKQASKQAISSNKQASKQANKQTNKLTKYSTYKIRNKQNKAKQHKTVGCIRTFTDQFLSSLIGDRYH